MKGSRLLAQSPDRNSPIKLGGAAQQPIHVLQLVPGCNLGRRELVVAQAEQRHEDAGGVVGPALVFGLGQQQQALGGLEESFAWDRQLFQAVHCGAPAIALKLLARFDGFVTQGIGETAQGCLGISLRYCEKKAGTASGREARQRRERPVLAHQPLSQHCRGARLLGIAQHGIEMTLGPAAQPGPELDDVHHLLVAVEPALPHRHVQELGRDDEGALTLQDPATPHCLHRLRQAHRGEAAVQLLQSPQDRSLHVLAFGAVPGDVAE